MSQRNDTHYRRACDTGWNYQYAYERAAEAREHDDIGQDYLSILEDHDMLSFVLCDGVGMSYFGDIAAKLVGDALIDWLSGLEYTMDQMRICDELDALLRDLASDNRHILEEHRIPGHIRGIHREVLLSKKQAGSSTMYACGRIDRPNKSHPDGRILLAWQGDIRIRLWSDMEERVELLGDRFDTSHRWNSHTGPVGGRPNVWCSSLSRMGRKGELLGYTDGLQALDGTSLIRLDTLEKVLMQEAENPASDDISMFYVQWNFEE